jgi:Spy/CpxP family protein refolding chaperone
MNKLFLSFLLTSTFVTSFVFAQRSGNPPSAAGMVQRRVGFLTKELTLTAAQQQQATTIFTNAATANMSVRDSLKTAHQSLTDAVKSNNSAGIDQASSTIGSLTAQMTAADSKAEAAFYQILTPDQQTKYTESQGRGFGGFGRGPGPGGFRNRQ